jgi:hypothetical protein
VKAELKRADVTYEELAERLRKHGFEETEASIANKLARDGAGGVLSGVARGDWVCHDKCRRNISISLKCMSYYVRLDTN